MAEDEDEMQFPMPPPAGAAARLDDAIEDWITMENIRALEGGTDVYPPVMVAGRYQALRLIEMGGQAGVFRAKDTELEREVALKLVENIRYDAERELMHEAHCLALLRHPNVVTIYDIVKCPEYGLVMVMELIPGEAANAWTEEAPRSWFDVLDVWLQAGRALQAAHEAGFIHGDISPTTCWSSRRPRASR